MLVRTLKLVALAAMLATGTLAMGEALAEPPPRGERAPNVDPAPGERPAFARSGWRPGYAIPPGWRPRYMYYESRYRVLDGSVIEATSDGTASWISRPLAHRFDDKTKACLNWDWSADKLPVLAAKEETREGDDFAIRLYVFGKLKSGKNYGFNYVWSVQHEPGAVWTSPFSSNRVMALRKGLNRSGKLLAESRNVAADLKKALGGQPATIESVAVMADSDSGGSVTAARISEITLGKCVEEFV